MAHSVKKFNNVVRAPCSLLTSIKSYSAKQIPNVMLHIGKVWQDGRYEQLIKDEKEFQNKWA